MELVFERNEYKQRVARTKEAMSRAGFDVLLVSNPANQFWLTGYDGWSFYTPQMVVVSLEEDEPFWFGRKMDAVGARFTAYLSEENVVAYPDKYVGSGDLHPMQYLVEVLKQRGLDTGRIAAEQDDYYYTARWNRILTEGLGRDHFEDGFLLVNRCRMVKSAREIEFMSQAGQIATQAMDSGRKLVRAGVRQCDVMAEIYRVTTAGTPEFGGTFPCKPPNAMVGELASARLLLEPLLLEYLRRYPGMSLELVTEGALIDITGQGFDAGFRLAEAVPPDMIAIPVTRRERMVVVGAPAYLRDRDMPRHPADLTAHHCIRARMASGRVYHWEFSRQDQSLAIDVPGQLILDESGLILQAALDGAGLAYVWEWSARPHLEAGRLLRMLDDWTPPYDGISLYYPGRRHVPAKLRALIALARELRLEGAR